MSTGRKRGWRAGWALVLGVVVAALAGSYSVSGAEGDGVIQPGDRTAPGRCTAGPVVDGVAFTAAHCTVDTIDGRRLQPIGSSPDPDGGPAGLDAQWFISESALSSSISTEFGDVPVVGVLHPWPGMKVEKSGWVSGTTSGFVFDAPDPLLAGSSVKGLKVCHGDSGSVVYARVGPTRDVYIVGMVTNGNGGTNRVTGEEEPNGTCSEFPPLDESGEVDYWATIRRVDALCEAAGLTDCVAEAGRVFGAIVGVRVSNDLPVVDLWAFDANDPARPATLKVTIDGRPAADVFMTESSAPTTVDYSLLPTVDVAASVAIEAAPGEHQVCFTALNDASGTDVDLGCRIVRVGPRYPGLAGGGPFGESSGAGPWWRRSLTPSATVAG